MASGCWFRGHGGGKVAQSVETLLATKLSTVQCSDINTVDAASIGTCSYWRVARGCGFNKRLPDPPLRPTPQWCIMFGDEYVAGYGQIRRYLFLPRIYKM